MKLFEAPVVEVVKFAIEDVITVSGETTNGLANEIGVCTPDL